MRFKEWLEKYGEIPKDAARKIVKDIKGVTGIPFKKKRERYESGDYEMSLNYGIFVLQSHNLDIPNFEEVLSYIKNQFGDVSHRHGRKYINARGFGIPYQDEPEGSIAVTALNPLPNVQSFSQKSVGKPEREVLREIDSLLSSRKASITGSPKVKLIGKLGATEKLVIHNNNLYIWSVNTAYHVSDEADARNLVRLMNLRMSILRDAEVRSWQDDDLSNPFGGRLP